MERDGGGSELVERRGEQVLAVVLLHVVEAAAPVDLRVDLAGLQGFLEEVQDGAVALLRVEHADAAERAAIAGLPAALRVEGGAVEDRGRAAVQLSDLQPTRA